MSHFVPERISPEGLTAFLHEQIPLTRAMELRAVEASAQRLILEAPLAPNKNHLGTAFGGALHTVPLLACYGALWMVLRGAGLDGHVVVKRSNSLYRSPVTGPIRAECGLPGPEAITTFLAALRRNQKARMELRATVAPSTDPAGEAAVEFDGSFVAVL